MTVIIVLWSDEGSSDYKTIDGVFHATDELLTPDKRSVNDDFKLRIYSEWYDDYYLEAAPGEPAPKPNTVAEYEALMYPMRIEYWFEVRSVVNFND